MKNAFHVLSIRLSLSFLLVISFNAGYTQSSQKTAGEILKQAGIQAAKEKKNVFIIFHASWCGWCHRMDSIMNSMECRELFLKNYVVAHLVVLESKDKKDLENPGAMDLLIKYHGDNQGIPFWLIFDAGGTLLADSQERPDGAVLSTIGKNTGCPATPAEVAYFIKVLKKTSLLDPGQLAVIEKKFSEK